MAVGPALATGVCIAAFTVADGLGVRRARTVTGSVAAYGLVLWAQRRGALAVVAALRETSVLAAGILALNAPR